MINTPKFQKGFSIVELMIALVIGLLLMTGVIQVFISSKQTYATNEAMARLQENGRFALEFIARSARIAGYTDPVYLGDKPLALVKPNCAGLPGSIPSTLCTTDGGGNVSDSVGFALQPQLLDGSRRDCAGNVITEDDMLIINHFEIIPATMTTLSSLGCKAYKFNTTSGSWTAGPTAQPLIEGIDSMQVLYGVNTSGDSRSANSYVSADRVTDWSKVRSVRISVLANSISTVTPPPPAERKYVLLDAAPLSTANLANDQRARQVFSTTIQLKNTD